MFKDQFEDNPADRVRTLDLGNNKIHLKREDPFGFVYVKFDRGLMPPELKGAYTSFEMAKRDVDAYLTKKGKDAVEVK